MVTPAAHISPESPRIIDAVPPGSLLDAIAVGLLILIAATAIFSTAIVQLLVVVLTVCLLAGVRNPRSYVFQQTPLDAPYLAFVAARIISILFSQVPDESLRALHIEVFFYIVFFLTTQTIRGDRESLVRSITNALILAGSLAALLGIGKVLCGLEDRASSTTSGTYTLGGYLCAVLPLLLFRNQRTASGNYLRWGLGIIFCLGIVATFDRLHWAALVLVLVAAALYHRRQWGVLAVIAAVAATYLIPAVRLRLIDLGDIQAWSGRALIWQGAMQLAGEHPLVGFGPRTFTHIFPLFHQLTIRGVSSWHNDYVQIYMDSGLLALLPTLWLVGATMYYSYRSIRSGINRATLLPLATSAGIFFLFGGMLDTIIGIVFRMILGMLALLLTDKKDG
jgi:O-antigen ligase